jgi:hypothetical protein
MLSLGFNVPFTKKYYGMQLGKVKDFGWLFQFYTDVGNLALEISKLGFRKATFIEGEWLEKNFFTSKPITKT